MLGCYFLFQIYAMTLGLISLGFLFGSSTGLARVIKILAGCASQAHSFTFSQATSSSLRTDKSPTLCELVPIHFYGSLKTWIAG